MRRRCFLFASLLAIVFTLLLIIPTIVHAEIYQIGPNLFIAGIPTNEFRYWAAPEQMGRQRMQNWCWAACLQMVLNFHGKVISQEAIVSQMFGSRIDAPASLQEVAVLAENYLKDQFGRYLFIHPSTRNITGPIIVEDLMNRRPLIVGMFDGNVVGHAYVLTAVTYSVDSRNLPIFHSVTLRDPWPGNPSRQEWAWGDFVARLGSAMRVKVISSVQIN